MEKNQESRRLNYPWKSFFVFLGLYIFGLVMHYFSIYEQARILTEVFGTETITNPSQYALMSLLQPLLLGIVAIYFGHRYVEHIGLRSLVQEKLEERQIVTGDKRFTFKDSIPFVVTFAVIIAIFEMGFDVVFQNFLPEVYQPNFQVPSVAQALSSIFYGGVAQEILLRWGIMAAVIYILSAKGENLNEWNRTIGIIFTAILYAFAQYSTGVPFVDVSFIIIVRILLTTGLAGILYGWLFTTFHFEAAVVSHVLANVLVIFGHSVIAGLNTL